MKDLNVINCIDAGNAALKCIVGHSSQVNKSIEESKSLPLEAMILRLLVMTVSITGTGKTVTSCGYDGWLWTQICKKKKRKRAKFYMIKTSQELTFN
jgi:hypothetical protein